MELIECLLAIACLSAQTLTWYAVERRRRKIRLNALSFRQKKNWFARSLPSSSRWREFRRHWWQRCRFSAPWLSRYSQTTHNTSANEIERAEFSNCSSAAQLNNQINYAKLARWIQIFIEVFLCNSKAHLLHHVFPRHSERVESLSEQVFAIFSRLAGQKRDFHIHRPRDVAVLNFLSIHS